MQNNWDRNGSMGDKISSGAVGAIGGGAILSQGYQGKIEAANNVLKRNNSHIASLKGQTTSLQKSRPKL